MAKIKKDEVLILSTEEALNLVKNADGRVRFNVKVSAFLPTSGDRGFEGMTFISVSKNEMCNVIKNVCGPVFEGRGAKIRLHLTAPTYKGALSFIALY